MWTNQAQIRRFLNHPFQVWKNKGTSGKVMEFEGKNIENSQNCIWILVILPNKIQLEILENVFKFIVEYLDHYLSDCLN